MGKKNNFLVQGSILAMAGIMSRVIGIIYRVPLNNILGDGQAAYAIAYSIYSLFLLISSLSLPLAVSKIVAARMAKGEIRNAKKALKGSLVLATVIGLVVSMIVFFFADGLATLWKFPSAAVALKVLAPTLFVMCILGVLRGFFQGLGTMIPTALSQIFEQIVNAVVSIIAAYVLFSVGDNLEESIAYSAAGGTLGTALGALTALLFVAFVYVLFSKRFNRMAKKDRRSKEESYAELGKVLAITIFPVLLSTTIYNIGSIIDSALYGNIMNGVFDIAESDYRAYWSIYSGQYKLLTTAPIAIASALSSAVIPSLIKSLTTRNYYALKSKISSSIKLTMIVAIPCAVGLSVMADPIIRVLFSNTSLHDDAVLLMRLSVLDVFAYSFSTITNSILQGIDKMRLPVIHSAIALGFHLVILPVLLLLKTDVFGVAVADIIFAFTVCILNIIAIKRHTGYRQEIKRTMLMPILASAIMGILAFIVYYGINVLTGMVLVPLIIAVVIAVITYGVFLMVFRAVGESELKSFPGGTKLVAVFRKVGLL